MQSNITKSHRVNWIDELKGFILILVCLSHARIHIPLGTVGGDLISICTAFRMSTFFFLSGLLFSTRRYSTIGSYIKNKTKTLLIPFVLLSLLFAFLDSRLYDISLIERNNELCMLYTPSDIQSSIDYFIMELVSIFYIAHPIIVGPLWFVFTLFLTSILFYCIHYYSEANIKAIVIYATFCLLMGWYCNIHHIILPYKIATVFTASFFFTLGYIGKNTINRLSKLSVLKLGCIILALSFIYLYAININGAINLFNNSLGNNIFGYALSTVSGIFLIVSTFICLNKFVSGSILQGILKNIARNALIILAVHYWAIQCCRIFLYPISQENYFPWLVTLIMTIVTALPIPLFRTKLYKLIGKEKITVKESLSIN